MAPSFVFQTCFAAMPFVCKFVEHGRFADYTRLWTRQQYSFSYPGHVIVHQSLIAKMTRESGTLWFVDKWILRIIIYRQQRTVLFLILICNAMVRFFLFFRSVLQRTTKHCFGQTELKYRLDFQRVSGYLVFTFQRFLVFCLISFSDRGEWMALSVTGIIRGQ
jgi:hypothetical protein